jgi:hypothetical protein
MSVIQYNVGQFLEKYNGIFLMERTIIICKNTTFLQKKNNKIVMLTDYQIKFHSKINFKEP